MLGFSQLDIENAQDIIWIYLTKIRGTSRPSNSNSVWRIHKLEIIDFSTEVRHHWNPNRPEEYGRLKSSDSKLIWRTAKVWHYQTPNRLEEASNSRSVWRFTNFELAWIKRKINSIEFQIILKTSSRSSNSRSAWRTTVPSQVQGQKCDCILKESIKLQVILKNYGYHLDTTRVYQQSRQWL